jgi:flagellar basal body-associated protein FliL
MSEEKPKEEAGAKKADSKNMLLIIIIAVLGTLLIAGGIGAVLMMRSGSHSTSAESADASDHEAAAEESHGSKEKEKEKDKDKGNKKTGKGQAQAIYIALDPPFVVNFETSQSARFLQVNVQLMTRDSTTSQVVKENEPVIRNDLLILLSSQTYETVSTASGKEELRKKALETVRAIIKQEGGKPDLLEAVYFTAFVMQ